MANDINYYAARALISLCGACALVFLYFFWINSQSPIEWHMSSVSPLRVRAGDTFGVSRQYTYSRDVLVTVTRRMEIGDCESEAGCDSYGLETNEAFMRAGYYNKIIYQRIPLRSLPGKYKLLYAVNWTWMGIRFSTPHPPLEIEVIP